jgi:hypothetical protein
MFTAICSNYQEVRFAEKILRYLNKFMAIEVFKFAS